MHSLERFDGTANDTNVTTVNSSSATDLMSGLTASHRRGVMVTNNSSTAAVYGKVKSGTSTPTVSSSNFHFKLNPGGEKVIQCGIAVKVWVINDTSPSSNTTCTIVELL